MNLTAVPLVLLVSVLPLVLPLLDRNPHDAARMVQLAILATMGLCAWADDTSHGTELEQGAWVRVLMVAGLATAAGTSVWTAAVPVQALRELALMLGLVVAARAGGRSLQTGSHRLWLSAITIGCAVYAAAQLLRIGLAAATGAPMYATDLTPGFANHRFFNHTQTVAVPLLAAAALWPGIHPLVRRLAWTSLAVQLALMMATTARATALGLLAGAAAVVVLRPLGIGRLMGCLARAAAAGALLYWLVFLVLPDLLGFSLDFELRREGTNLDSGRKRLELWRSAVQMARAAPWVGQGPMHFAHVPNPEAAHPHSIYLQLAAEWGVLMLLAGLLAAGSLLWRLGRRLRHEAHAEQALLGSTLCLAVVAVLVDGAFSGNFVMPIPQMWMALALGWAWAWAHPMRQVPGPLRPHMGMRPRPMSPPVVGRHAVWIVVLAGQLWLCVVAAREFDALPEHLRQTSRQLADNPRDNPRFWSHGWF